MFSLERFATILVLQYSVNATNMGTGRCANATTWEQQVGA